MRSLLSFYLTPTPLISLTIALIGGIHVQYQPHLLPFIAAYIVLALILLPQKTVYMISATLLMSVSGTILYQYQQDKYRAFLATTQGQTADIIAKIDDVSSLEHAYLKQRTILSTQDIKNNNTWQTLYGKIVLNTQQDLHIKVGDTIMINELHFSQKRNNTSSLRNGHYVTLFPRNVEYTILERSPFCLKRLIHNIRLSIYERITKHLSPYTFSLFSTLFLGNKTKGRNLLTSIRASFKQWGITHYLARSGLHLMIILMIWHYILAFFSLSILGQSIIMLILVFLYALLSWQSVSFLRALLTFALYKIFLLLKIRLQAIDLVALVCMLVLLTNPYQLFCLDFQLSFSLTFALAWLRFANLKQVGTNH